MAACKTEIQKVENLEELIADLQPSSDESPRERALAQRQSAPLRRQLIVAKAALANCRRLNTSYEVRLRVIRMADEDGSNQTNVTEANAAEWVRVANVVFVPARLRILFDTTSDFETQRNTRLNQLVEGTGLQADTDAVNDAIGIADQFPNRIVVICRTGRALTIPPFGNCGPGCGYSWFPGKYVMMPAFDPNFPTLLAHELGHYFGLPHTFKYVIDTTSDARIVFDILGNDLSTLEGDISVVTDTPPEMIIRDQDAGSSTSIMFANKTISFLRNNIMSYFRPLMPTDRTITPSQASRVLSVLQQRRNAGLSVTEVQN